MKLFDVLNAADSACQILELKASNLLGLVQTICGAIPISELASDDGYLVRIADDGRIEVGYRSDHWSLQ